MESHLLCPWPYAKKKKPQCLTHVLIEDIELQTLLHSKNYVSVEMHKVYCRSKEKTSKFHGKVREDSICGGTF